MNLVESPELLHARDLLLSGEAVAVPTETVYGLAASIESESGLRKIFSLKERPFFDPLIVHVSGLQQAMSLVSDWQPVVDFIARTFWPGPLTLVLPKAAHVNPLITSGLETVAVRIPAHPILQELIELVGHGLAAPSANKFGRTSPTTAAHVQETFLGDDVFILDGGPCEIGVESTVIDFKDSQIRILRPGAVTEEMLRAALLKWSNPITVTRAVSEASPGHLKHHYMPSVPLFLVDASEPQGLSAATQARAREESKLALQHFFELSLSSEPSQAARELYSRMREIPARQCDALYFRVTPEMQETGLWAAILDRLKRAATQDFRS